MAEAMKSLQASGARPHWDGLLGRSRVVPLDEASHGFWGTAAVQQCSLRCLRLTLPNTKPGTLRPSSAAAGCPMPSSAARRVARMPGEPVRASHTLRASTNLPSCEPSLMDACSTSNNACKQTYVSLDCWFSPCKYGSRAHCHNFGADSATLAAWWQAESILRARLKCRKAEPAARCMHMTGPGCVVQAPAHLQGDSQGPPVRVKATVLLAGP